jgi:hypothetical protein
LEKTFEGLTKRKFLSIINDRIFVSDWTHHQLMPRNYSLYILGKKIGLSFIESKKLIKPQNSNNHAFYKIVDIPNYDKFINLFNSLHPISKIDDDYYIVKDNFNHYLEEINQPRLSDYSFKKLSTLTGYKIIKKLK